MNINLKRTVLVACLVITAGFASDTLAQQAQANAPSQLRLVSFHGDMGALLSQLGPSFGVTIGFEADPRKPNSEVTVEVREATFQDVLNAIVQSEPRYQWREVDGVFEVFPIGGSNPLLEIPIGYLQLSEVSGAEAVNQLMGLPEVSTVTTAMKLKNRPAVNPPARTNEQKFSISLAGVTMRQALGQIAKKSSAKFWVFRKYDDGTFSVDTTY